MNTPSRCLSTISAARAGTQASTVSNSVSWTTSTPPAASSLARETAWRWTPCRDLPQSLRSVVDEELGLRQTLAQVGHKHVDADRGTPALRALSG